MLTRTSTLSARASLSHPSLNDPSKAYSLSKMHFLNICSACAECMASSSSSLEQTIVMACFMSVLNISMISRQCVWVCISGTRVNNLPFNLVVLTLPENSGSCSHIRLEVFHPDRILQYRKQVQLVSDCFVFLFFLCLFRICLPNGVVWWSQLRWYLASKTCILPLDSFPNNCLSCIWCAYSQTWRSSLSVWTLCSRSCVVDT